MVPKIISKGLEVMCLEYGKIRVLDSLNFLPMGLADLPKAFGQTELKKGYFPHKFNTSDHQDYIGPMPDSWYYDPGNMKEDKRNAFYAWYTKQLGKQFDFQSELLDYCRSDVDILCKCCLKFEELFHQETGVKPFNVAITIASACMHVFRRNFMKPNTIALIPPSGFARQENQSVTALRWLAWVGHSQNRYIQHARNLGEKAIRCGTKLYKVDGYHAESKTVYEFQGCIWHGCLKCYQDRTTPLPKSHRTVEDAYQDTLDKVKALENAGYTVVQMWGCELNRELARNPQMTQYFRDLDLPDHLVPKDALRGGRTNAIQLYRKCKEGEKISYLDVCSLYPWGVKWTEFPVGHPEIIMENFEPISAEHNPYFGLIKATVLPPRRLYHPVLPYSCNGKLLFPLCRTCAEEKYDDYCPHTDAERAFTGTFVSTEFNKALQMGYEVVKTHSVWHYPQRDQHDGKDPMTGLFTR